MKEKTINFVHYTLISYNDTVVFEYSGGAIGGDCFLGREEHLKVKSKN